MAGGQGSRNNSRPQSPNGPIRMAGGYQPFKKRSPRQNTYNGVKSPSYRNDLHRSCDSHVTENNDTRMYDGHVHNRFRGLIDKLQVDDASESGESSLMDYSEWEQMLGPLPSVSQLVSLGNSQAPPSLADGSQTAPSLERLTISCDQSCDQSCDRLPHQNGDVHSQSCEQNISEWDVAPVVMSGASPPNKLGLIPAHVSEVCMLCVQYVDSPDSHNLCHIT